MANRVFRIFRNRILGSQHNFSFIKKHKIINFCVFLKKKCYFSNSWELSSVSLFEKVRFWTSATANLQKSNIFERVLNCLKTLQKMGYRYFSSIFRAIDGVKTIKDISYSITVFYYWIKLSNESNHNPFATAMNRIDKWSHLILTKCILCDTHYIFQLVVFTACLSKLGWPK